MQSLLVHRFVDTCRRGRTRLAIEDDRESVTFEELEVRALGIAADLVARGLSKQRVALLSTQGARWVEAFFGIVLARATVVPLSHLHPEAEQRWFVEASRSAALIASQEMAARAAELAGDRPLIAIEESGTGPAIIEPVPTADDDVALILYTSGTTGKPKGALISHYNLEELARLVGKAWEWNENDVLLHCLPLHHLHGLGISLFVSLLAGGKTRMLEKPDAPRLWDEMARSTVLMGVPTLHKRLIDTFDAADDATRARWREHARGLRLVTSGSAALPVSLGERWRELTGEYPLERFGMTEIGVGATNPIRGPRIPATCGPVLPGMELRIVDDSGRDVAPGESGEIWIRGPSVFLCYDGDLAITREAFSDGWFKSGDTATFLEGGYVKILGRTSVDILKSGGYKLSALEIEEVLREHEAIADVAVVGLPDETWGEIAVAAVIAREGRADELSEERLRAWAKERIASYKVPKRVVVLPDFPRNPVGKVQKPELAKRLRGG